MSRTELDPTPPSPTLEGPEPAGQQRAARPPGGDELRRAAGSGGSDDGGSHAQEVEAAFARSQAEQWASVDTWVGSVALALLMMVPNKNQDQAWAVRPLAAALEVFLLALPGALAWWLPKWYIPRRTPIIVMLRLANWALMASATLLPPVPPLAGWPSWPAFMALTRCLSLNVYAWASRVPFKVFVVVHLIGLAEASRLAVISTCRLALLSSSSAQCQFAAAGHVADKLAGVFDPMGHSQSVVAGGRRSCACIHWALFLLATVGAGFPIMCQFITQAAAKRSFVRSYCRRRSCSTCGIIKGTDVAMLAATAALLYVGFCAACWHLSASLAPLLPCDLGMNPPAGPGAGASQL